MSGTWTIRSVLEWIVPYLKEANFPNPRLDAELIVAHSLKRKRIELYLFYFQPLTSTELSLIRTNLKRRRANEPIAYITQAKEFWSLDFFVDNRVLIPRPETELIVETARNIFSVSNGIRIIDVCTGSGNIAIALSQEFPLSDIIAIDCSADALKVAAINKIRHSAERVSLVQADLLEAVRRNSDIDLIVANPPYLSEKEFSNISEEIRDFEPRSALASPENGLSHIKRIVDDSLTILRNGGYLLCEIGSGHGAIIRELIEKLYFPSRAIIIKDLAGFDRIVQVRKIEE